MVSFRLSAEERDFRDEIRSFLRDNVPAEIREKVSTRRELAKEEFVAAQQILNTGGLAVPGWPIEWGGKDWTPMQFHIWRQELSANSVPPPLDFNTSMVGPVIAEFGSQEVKERFLPATANLDIWWSQGFSEPEAGSDLASIRTTAVRDGDDWVVNGQKTWTTYGQYGDWIFTLVRTDPNAPKRQQGISFLLIDMRSPGVVVRPIELVDGSFEVNEVFFENVRVSGANLVGQPNEGWSYAKFLLGNERAGIGDVGLSKHFLAVAKESARDLGLLEDHDYAKRFLELENDLLSVELTALRVAGGSSHGEPDPVSSILKLHGSQLAQAVDRLIIDIAGPGSLASGASTEAPAPEWVRTSVPNFLNDRKLSIFGGSNEVQRTIIAKTILGL